MNFSLNQISYGDPRVWDLICSGKSNGIFQLESNLCKHWLKKIKPRNLWELSIFVSIIRPGPLMSGYADLYVEYKEGKEFETFGNPIVDEIFNTTNHCMIFQEQLMSLGAKLAWSDLDEKTRLQKVDGLRKAVGKKLSDKLLIIGKDFVEGCVKNNIDKALADKLFDTIQNCGRYLFNLAHAMSYAYKAYETAYLKVYYPLQFMAVYLSYAKFKQSHKKEGKEIGGKWNEIKDIINESKILGINCLPPNINAKNENFSIEGDAVRYGLSHMKYFGGSTMGILRNLPQITDWRQVLALCCTDRFGKKLGSRAAEALIVTGAFGDCKVSRTSLLNAYHCIDRLTGREQNALFDLIDNGNVVNIKELPAAVCKTGDIANKTRREKVLAEASILNVDSYDNPAWVALQEKTYLGIALTACAVDDKVTDNPDRVIDCVAELPDFTKRSLAVVINEIKYTTTKKGKNPGAKMCFLSVYDSSGQLDKLPVFPEAFEAMGDILMEKNTVALSIVKGKGGFFVEGGYQL